jgi:hypothetical protein
MAPFLTHARPRQWPAEQALGEVADVLSAFSCRVEYVVDAAKRVRGLVSGIVVGSVERPPDGCVSCVLINSLRE